MYYNPSTKEKKSREDLKEMLNASIPEGIEQIGEDWFLIHYADQEYDELKNTITGDIELIDGKWTQTYRYEDKSADELLRMSKDRRSAVLNSLKVEYNGHSYDADETSQGRMVRFLSSTNDDTKAIQWIDANNEIQELNRSDIAAILALAVDKTAEIWVEPYTKVLGW